MKIIAPEGGFMTGSVVALMSGAGNNTLVDEPPSGPVTRSPGLLFGDAPAAGRLPGCRAAAW